MATKFILDDWSEEDALDLSILAISTELPNYRLAYTLNKAFSANFKEMVEPLVLTIQGITASFSIFSGNTQHQNSVIAQFLINNSSYSATNTAQVGLFGKMNQSVNLYQNKTYNWNYLLLSDNPPHLHNLNKRLKNLPIKASQLIDFDSLNKSKQQILKGLFYEN